jgi:hypothetical protein
MEMKQMPNVYLCGARLFFTALFSNISLYILINRNYYFYDYTFDVNDRIYTSKSSVRISHLAKQ